MSNTATRHTRVALVLCSIAAAIATAPCRREKAEPVREPNYDLASQWTPARSGSWCSTPR